MLTLLPTGAQTKLLKFFCLKIFYICHRCRWHRWCTFSREYLREFSKKFEMAVMLYSHAWGKLIHEKKQKSKISWHCPFKEPNNRFQGTNSAKLCSLAGRFDNLIPTRFLAPIDCLKISAQDTWPINILFPHFPVDSKCVLAGGPHVALMASAHPQPCT